MLSACPVAFGASSLPSVQGMGRSIWLRARTYVLYVARPPAKRPPMAGMPTATRSSAYSTITAPLALVRARFERFMSDDPPAVSRATNLPMEVRSQRNSEEQSRSKAKPRQRGFLHGSLLRLG